MMSVLYAERGLINGNWGVIYRKLLVLMSVNKLEKKNQFLLNVL